VEIYNLSDLEVISRNSINGYVGGYALDIYKSKDRTSKLHTAGDYIFYEDDDRVYLMGYVGTQTELTLPDKYNNKNYSIYEYVFYNCSNLTSVTISNGVTLISRSAFEDCKGLINAVIPSSVTYIDWDTFSGCSSLTSVYYGGTSTEWQNISIDNGNYYLNSATIYYYSKEEPTEEGNWWHYVDGEVVVWGEDN
jgi:hypothetical protein